MAEYHLFELLFSNFVDLGDFVTIFGITEIACAIICLRKDGCSSFFYHADEMNCVPSLTKHLNSSLLKYKDGYKYYITGPDTDCEQGWELFMGKCYYFEYDMMDFAAAQANCIAKGGNLAQTDSAAEHSFFISLGQRGGNFWVGGKRVNGNWTWLDGSAITSGYWAPDQPSGGTSCLQLWEQENGLDDESCAEIIYSLCEK